MFKKFFAIFCFVLTIVGCSTQKKLASGKSESESPKPEKEGLRPYNKVITDAAVSDEGLFTTHEVNGKLYFEIQDSLLDRDMLLVSRIAKVPNGFGGGYVNAGSKVNEQVLHWSRRKGNIYLKVISFQNQGDPGSPIYKSVEANNFYPILYSAKIAAYTPDSTGVVIQVNDLFEEDIAAINAISPALKKQYKVKKLDKGRSYIASAKAFPKNVEVRHVMTYEAEEPPESDQAGTITILMNQSMILLPDDKMQPRLADDRVGWFSVKKYDYNSDALKSDDYEIIRRWRLVPEDMEAYKNGELVAPKKPIVYYLDPATPMKWRPYFKKGIEDWNKAFEKAGFKNAIIAKDPPSQEEDPDFSPEDVRYSVIRYVASTTRNAVGPSVIDPRTGEIISSDIIWYHNHLRSYRNRYMIEAGAQNENARTLDTPEAEIGEMMRMVIAHEVGHALGLPHNMKASSAYPTDSLRIAGFTQKYGLTPSIMDYARVNYVAQPEDKGVRLIRMMGPYDLYAINWGYRYLPEATAQLTGLEAAKAEKDTLDQWILDKAGDPIYEFGSGYDGIDPHSQRESLGDDNVKASTYGLANLKKVVPNLIKWTAKDGKDYDDLEEVYNELINLWRGYIYHVITNVGGVYETRKTTDQEGEVYIPVPAEMQKKAVAFLNKNAFTTPNWLLNEEILNRIEPSGDIKRVQQLQTRCLNYLLETDRLKRMVNNTQRNPDSAYTAIDMLGDVRKGIFSELFAGRTVDAYRRNVQRSFIDAAVKVLKEAQENQGDELLKSDVTALMRGELEQLKSDLDTRKNRTRDTLTRYHYKDLLARIEGALTIGWGEKA